MSTGRLRKEDFEPLAPDDVGNIRVNHDSSDCAGSSKSMVVNRNDDMSVSAKCFRCGQTGFVGSSKYKPSFTRTPIKIKEKRSGVRPTDTSYEWKDFPVDVIAYLNKCHFTEAMCSEYEIGFSNKINRLVIPVNNLHQGYSGYITKSFDPSDTRYYSNFPDPRYAYNHVVNGDREREVVVCEDVLSSIRASKVLSSFALCGTELTSHARAELIDNYDTFYLWLDNDNRQVKLKQLKIKDELSLFGKVYLIYSDKEPKHLLDSELEIFFI